MCTTPAASRRSLVAAELGCVSSRLGRPGFASVRAIAAIILTSTDNQTRMANYYPLLANVIAALEDNSAELRRRLYESIRNGFLEQMRKHDPPLRDSYIKQEQIALEEAIRKVEAEQISLRSGPGDG